MNTLPKSLREIKKGKLEVRMVMNRNEAQSGSLPHYEIRNTSEGNPASNVLSTIQIHKQIPIIYSVFCDFPGEDTMLYPLGFALTKSGADRLAHRQAVSLANKIAQCSSPYLPVTDLSERDREDFARKIAEAQK